MLVLILWQGRTLAVPLSQLQTIKGNKHPMKPSLTGTTGWPKATVSDPAPGPSRNYASLPKAHLEAKI
jgi:hypothetical protein